MGRPLDHHLNFVPILQKQPYGLVANGVMAMWPQVFLPLPLLQCRIIASAQGYYKHLLVLVPS